MDIQELLRRKKEQLAAKKTARINTVKPENGKHMYRILPSWRKPKAGEPEDKQFYHDYGQHFVRAEKGGKPVAFVCADKTFEQACDICAALGSAISRAQDDATLELLKGANASQRFLLNVLHLSNTDEAKRSIPQVMEVGVGVFNNILDIMEDYGDITDLKSGLDLVIKREGSGLDTEYSVLPSPKGARAIDPSVMEKVTDLDAFVANASETQKAKALANLSTASGLLPAPTPTAAIAPPAEPAHTPVARAAASLADEAEDASFEDMPPWEDEIAEPVLAAAKSAPVDDEDDLDALLEKLA